MNVAQIVGQSYRVREVPGAVSGGFKNYLYKGIRSMQKNVPLD